MSRSGECIETENAQAAVHTGLYIADDSKHRDQQAHGRREHTGLYIEKDKNHRDQKAEHHRERTGLYVVAEEDECLGDAITVASPDKERKSADTPIYLSNQPTGDDGGVLGGVNDGVNNDSISSFYNETHAVSPSNAKSLNPVGASLSVSEDLSSKSQVAHASSETDNNIYTHI